jgi:pimeloyl-ACP methyl ester carboxylesterase
MRAAPVLALLLAFSGAPLAVAAENPARSVASADGVEIRYEVAGEGSPPIVFVHGWSCDRTYWREQVPHFAGSHRVVSIDLGGHGESGTGREEWTMAAFGADVAAVLEHADLRGAVLVGHSMGGPVILEAARLAPGRVAALVPVDTLQDVEDPVDPGQLDALVAGLRADFAATTNAFVRSMFSPTAAPALVDRIARDMSAAPPAVGISALANTFRHDTAAALAAVTVPVRLINADKWPTDLEAARRHKADVELAVMPGVGHFLMAEEPDEFNRWLERAVRELTRR